MWDTITLFEQICVLYFGFWASFIAVGCQFEIASCFRGILYQMHLLHLMPVRPIAGLPQVLWPTNSRRMILRILFCPVHTRFVRCVLWNTTPNRNTRGIQRFIIRSAFVCCQFEATRSLISAFNHRSVGVERESEIENDISSAKIPPVQLIVR
jgi:hypothetical protein